MDLYVQMHDFANIAKTNEEADEDEYFDNCSESENDIESDVENRSDKLIDKVDCKYYHVTLFSCFVRWQMNFKKVQKSFIHQNAHVFSSASWTTFILLHYLRSN